MHLYLVCYDISDDRSRAVMASRLLDFGVRVQYSVYECLLDDERYGRLVTGLQAVRLAPEDRVRVYKLCTRCVQMVVVYGSVPTPEPDWLLV